jgi:antirestriction protein ArdC
MANNKIQEMVTSRIIEKLENGCIPWVKPWKNWNAINYVTRKPYQGINKIMLDRGGEYLTFNQIKKLEGKLKKGSKGVPVVFYKMFETTEKNKQNVDVKKTIPFLRYSTVFHLSDTMGIETKIPAITKKFVPDQKAEGIVVDYTTRENIKVINQNVNRAYYSPSEDLINMPKKAQFKSTEEYYSTMFHEMVHSTGHETRLKRHNDTKQIAAKSEVDYSKEELVAEIGAGMLCGICNMFENTVENTAAYCKSWLSVLNDDSSFIISASSKAGKAVEFIAGKQV